MPIATIWSQAVQRSEWILQLYIFLFRQTIIHPTNNTKIISSHQYEKGAPNRTNTLNTVISPQLLPQMLNGVTIRSLVEKLEQECIRHFGSRFQLEPFNLAFQGYDAVLFNQPNKNTQAYLNHELSNEIFSQVPCAYLQSCESLRFEWFPPHLLNYAARDCAACCLWRRALEQDHR